MSLKNKLKEAYSNKVTAPKGCQELNNKVEIKKTHHTLFKTIKLTALISVGAACTFILTGFSYFFLSSMQIHEHTADSVRKVRFSMYDTNLIESETFKYLNHITYDEKMNYMAADEDFVTYVNQFAEKTYSGFDKTNNFAYSPLMAYTQMDLISLALSTPETIEEMNNALGTSDTSFRESNVYKAMVSNSFASKEDKSTVQTKNAVFYDSHRAESIKPAFLEGLTNRRAEVYDMSYDSPQDVNNILKWVDQSVNADGFLNTDDLEISEYTFMTFMSSLYFDNRWSSKYIAADTKDDDFHLLDGSVATTKFMNHVIINEFKDYGNYVSVTDDYRFGYSVEYFVPKKLEDSIFDLLASNFLNKEPVEKDHKPISLSMPKFELTCKNEMTDIVKGAGIVKIYDKYGDCLGNASERDFERSYIDYTKQKTVVSFDEDGTIVKSITFGNASGMDSYRGNGYQVNLNQPFVYCIKDRSGLPLVLGAVTNPIQ